MLSARAGSWVHSHGQQRSPVGYRHFHHQANTLPKPTYTISVRNQFRLKVPLHPIKRGLENLQQKDWQRTVRVGHDRCRQKYFNAPKADPKQNEALGNYNKWMRSGSHKEESIQLEVVALGCEQLIPGWSPFAYYCSKEKFPIGNRNLQVTSSLFQTLLLNIWVLNSSPVCHCKQSQVRSHVTCDCK